MTERAAPTQPPLSLDGGRFLLYADGEYQAFSRDLKSWTTGTLDSRDLGKLLQFLPIVRDNTL